MRAGFYEAEITPPLGLRIPGYFTPRRAEGVKQKLYAKAAVLESGGVYAAFLAVDAVGLPVGLAKTVRERVTAATPIPENAILVAVTHSHTSMPVTFEKPSLDQNYTQEDVSLNSQVIELTALRAADAVILAWQRLQEAEAWYAKGRAEGVSFIRQYRIKDGSIRTNPGYCIQDVEAPIGAPDTELPMLLFKDPEGNPIGSISSFALHHDTVSGCEYSSDYSGMVAAALKQDFGPDFVSVFFAGFCGDINHLNYLNPENIKTPTAKIAEVIVQAVHQALERCEKLEDTLAVQTRTVQLEKRRIDPELIARTKALVQDPPGPGPMSIADPYSDRMLYSAADGVLAWYDTNKQQIFDQQVQVIRLGDCLIGAVGGEQFSWFAYRFREAVATDKTLLVGYAHSETMRAYVPPKHMFLPFVYESSIYSAKYEPGSGEKLSDAMIELAQGMLT